MFGVLFVTAETALELFIPVIMANIIDVGVPAGDITTCCCKVRTCWYVRRFR